MTEKKGPRVPGMVWTILAFAPWILYWVLAGMGNTTAAILLGLGVSLAINGYRFAVRKVKILDVVSLVFLSIATLVTLVLRSDFMVFYGGVLSDTTLALVAWGSLIVGNPFTYDYAKEDWDEAFWDNPIFIKTNQIITAVWGVIFTVQALAGGTADGAGARGIGAHRSGGRHSPLLVGVRDFLLGVVSQVVSAAGGAAGWRAHRR